MIYFQYIEKKQQHKSDAEQSQQGGNCDIHYIYDCK